jgi:hypothetical protein
LERLGATRSAPGGAGFAGAEHVVDGGAEPVELVGDGERPLLDPGERERVREREREPVEVVGDGERLRPQPAASASGEQRRFALRPARTSPDSDTGLSESLPYPDAPEAAVKPKISF